MSLLTLLRGKTGLQETKEGHQGSELSVFHHLCPHFRFVHYKWLLHWLEEGHDPKDFLYCLRQKQKEWKKQQAPLLDFLETHPHWVREVQAYIEELKEKQVHLLYPGHPDYPRSFLELSSPPMALLYRGSPCWKNESRLLSVVGSREPQEVSLLWMEEHLAPLIKEEEVVIVSGGARGIDKKAHWLALRQEKPTLVFLPSGLENPYPAQVQDWLGEVFRCQGAVVSEFPLDASMRKCHFPQRNRLIAQISPTTLVVEARQRSGSMITAQRAVEQNREVITLPAFPLDFPFQGNVQLLFDGASMVRDFADLRALFKANSE